MINIEPKHFSGIVSILEEFLPKDVSVFIFGSRINGTAKKFSDVDLCLKSDDAISNEIISHLEEAFSLSDLPYGIDIVVYSKCTDAFRAIIDANNVKIYPEDKN
ncbi:MAG: nucleotidyltransferase domain-containing protein [Puniceicoccales bacterium]|jgi:type I restriction enzyme S subunit|nr:nucleotidyltransferase domain-containing protein [Puniceicoccales bacterium]